MDNLELITQDMKGRTKFVTKNMSGEVVEVREQPNMIVRNIRPIIVQMLAQSGYLTPLPKIDTIKFGDSGAPSTVNDPTLKGNTLLTKSILSAAALSDGNRKATYSVILADNEGNGMNIREAGLYSGEVMVARTTFGTYTKADGTYFEFYWTIGYDG